MKKHLSIFLVILCPLFVFSQNIGIGTTTPDFKLDIESLTDARARVYSPNSSYAGFLVDNSLQQYFIGVESSIFNSRFSIYDNTAGALRFQISTTGNVGIGNITPSAKLQVEGGIKADSIDVQSGLIRNVADPISVQDAATKGYVDGEISSLPTITTYSVGDFAQGGIVFWVDETGQHGLVCAKSDQSSGIRWYAGTYGNTQAKGDGPYSGEANTTIIIAAQVAIGDDGSTYAARICNELQVTEGGTTYGDWYLPSKYELELMYDNKATIDATALANGGVGFADDYYWSSSEYNSSSAWSQDFLFGFQNYFNKDYNITEDFPNFVRAVRAF